jgi:hypothetical protein
MLSGTFRPQRRVLLANSEYSSQLTETIGPSGWTRAVRSAGPLKAHIDTGRQCARQCAQTRSKDRQSAANANQAANKNGPEINRFQARSVIPGSLSKPPPSASRPPHRARKLSIRQASSYAELHVPTIVPEIVPDSDRSPLESRLTRPGAGTQERHRFFSAVSILASGAATAGRRLD